MEPGRASHGGMFDLFAQPFRILGVDPTATDQQIEEAFRIALKGRRASADSLTKAVDALLDPSRRLFYELRYPLDCPASKIEVFYAALSVDAPTDQLLQFSDLLWPLARANFIADIASRRPADGALLYALLESHASIEATEIYAKITAARTTAGLPAPSWSGITEGLGDLLKTHAAAAFAGYDTVQDAAEPVLECTKRALAQGERHFVDPLAGILAQYRQAIDPLRKDSAERIERGCATLQQQPIDDSVVEEVSNAVQIWTSLCRPLLVWDAHDGRSELDFDAPIGDLRGLITNLVENKHYELAIRIVDLTRDLFDAVPTTIEQLAEDARVIASLSLYVNIKPLQDAIKAFENDPGPLIAGLEKDGFGPTSTESAKYLWEVFLQAARAAHSTPSADLPWRLTRDFAIRLSNIPEAAEAVARFITGLIQYGERVSAAPQILKALRDNLSFMNSFMAAQPATESTDGVQATSRTGSVVSRLFRKRTLRNDPESARSNQRYHRRLSLAGLALFTSAVLGVFVFYVGFDQLGSLWSKASLGAVPPVALGAETMPPVGTGQQLALEGVRYCHFQEARLRIIKTNVQGPEEARAYNLLIVDYNSRCSDFFYKDDDLKLVLAEVSANQNLLEADAKRIMSTWPGRTAEAQKK